MSRKTQMTMVVDGCTDCPFYASDNACDLDGRAPFIHGDDRTEAKAPEWCQLRAGKVTVKGSMK